MKKKEEGRKQISENEISKQTNKEPKWKKWKNKKKRKKESKKQTSNQERKKIQMNLESSILWRCTDSYAKHTKKIGSMCCPETVNHRHGHSTVQNNTVQYTYELQ